LNGHLGFLPSALTVKFVSFSENTGTSVFINLYQLVKNTYLKRLNLFFQIWMITHYLTRVE